MTRHTFVIGLCLVVAVLAVPAKAQAPDPKASSEDWSFTFAPYLWASALEGDVATLPPAPPANVDAGFDDILDNLDIAFMGIGEVRKGRFAVVVDLIYIDLTDDASTPGPLFSGAELETQAFVGTFQGSYRVLERERGLLDLRAGVRVWSVSTELALDAGLLPARKVDETETWVDPVVGFQGRLNLGNRFYITTMANIGGFGVGSDLTWDALAGLGYQVNDWFAPFVGYRHLSVDYDKDDFLFDAEISGPLIGGIIRF